MKIQKFNEYNNNGEGYATNQIPENLPKCITDMFRKINMIHDKITNSVVNDICILNVHTGRWHFDKEDLLAISNCEYFFAMKLDDSVINKDGKIVLEFRYACHEPMTIK